MPRWTGWTAEDVLEHRAELFARWLEPPERSPVAMTRNYNPRHLMHLCRCGAWIHRRYRLCTACAKARDD